MYAMQKKKQGSWNLEESKRDIELMNIGMIMWVVCSSRQSKYYGMKQWKHNYKNYANQTGDHIHM